MATASVALSVVDGDMDMDGDMDGNGDIDMDGDMDGLLQVE